uniref:Uncharacterized protein n=1 Tax=Anopheles melas TaxID=34690 RepID=A0A182TFT9_9DIPT
MSAGAITAPFSVFDRNVGQLLAFSRKPSGGFSISPDRSQCPIGWISFESTSRQKSFLLSPPSSRRRKREPSTPTTVAMQVEVMLRGSSASSFMLILNSFLGGISACLKHSAGAGTLPDSRKYSDQSNTWKLSYWNAPVCVVVTGLIRLCRTWSKPAHG